MMGEALWSSQEVASATGGTAGGLFWAESVAIDSRSLKPGALYIALKGARTDGHDYVAAALDKGAVAAIVHQPVQGIPLERLVVVEDTAHALSLLGTTARKRSKAKIIGITGSIGKTTTKEMVALMCRNFARTYATQGNFNNHFGVPLMLANMPKDAEFGVFEMGMNHSGEIAVLAKQVLPHIAIITSVEAVHLEYFESVTAIADAKCEIFYGLQPGGTAILNMDNQYFAHCQKIAKRFHPAEILGVGYVEGADVRAVLVQDMEHGMTCAAVMDGRRINYTLAASGDGALYASLMALATAKALGLESTSAARALAKFQEVAGRGRVQEVTFEKQRMWWMDDSYNASPASMRAAFKKLARFAEHHAGVTRRIVVMGDMLELGHDAPQFHSDLAEALIAAKVDKVFAAGHHMKHLFDVLPAAMQGCHSNLAEALELYLRRALKAGDAVLFKGSHGSKIYQLVEMLQQDSARQD